jgi:hypothetical protein
MSHIVSATAPITGAHTVKKYAGFGIFGADISTTGDSGGSPLVNDTLDPAGEYYWRVETPPSSGTVTIYPDATFTHTGAADGVWTWQYRVFKTGVDQGVATVTDTFGAAATSLLIASALHAHIADNLTLGTTDSTSLSVQDSMHAHTADGVSLSAAAYLAIADAIHAHLADNIGLSTAGSASLAISDAFHGHSADGIALTLDSLLSISESIHAHFADALVLSIPSAPGSYPTAVEIAAAILAAAQITPIHANIKEQNDEQVIGDGSTGNKWRSHLVP